MRLPFLAHGLAGLAVLAAACADDRPVPQLPPELKVVSPVRGTMQEGLQTVQVIGTVAPNPETDVAVANVEVNGVTAAVDVQGNFTAAVPVHAGANFIKTVATGTAGELCTRGYSVMLGYWEDPEKTREAIDAEGWMHTGDLATMDAEGYVNIVGRIKDMVIRGGENIYPREIEEFLYRMPQVQDVQVVGVPDRKYGEELAAWIIVKPGQELTEEQVRAFCQGQIAHYKIPRYLRFVPAFPMTVTGKIQKFKIREAMKDELGLREEKTA